MMVEQDCITGIVFWSDKISGTWEGTVPKHRAEAYAAMLAAPVSATVARGDFVIVPRTPTQAMLRASWNAAQVGRSPDEDRDCWKAMLAAAPAPAEPVQPVAKPLCYVRTLNGEIDWSEDCLHPIDDLCDYDPEDGYAMLALGPIVAPVVEARRKDAPTGWLRWQINGAKDGFLEPEYVHGSDCPTDDYTGKVIALYADEPTPCMKRDEKP